MLTTFRPISLLVRTIIAIRKPITYLFTRNAPTAIMAGKFSVEITSCNIKNKKQYRATQFDGEKFIKMLFIRSTKLTASLIRFI